MKKKPTNKGDLETGRAGTNEEGSVAPGRGSRRKPASPIAIPGERVVKETDKTERLSSAHPPRTNQAAAGPAMDQRKHFTGTDQGADD